MKRISILLSFILASFTNAQVGIGSYEPKATLDVVGQPDQESIVDGILIPRLTGDQLRAKNAIYTNLQNSTLVYVTEADSNPTGKTIEITSPGYYYYHQPDANSTGIWLKIFQDNHWKIQNTSNSATSNTDNIYQKGKVAIGFDETTPMSNAQLEVKGSALIQNTNSSGNISSLTVSDGLSYLTTQEFLNPFQGKYSALSSTFTSNSLGTFHGNGTNDFIRQSLLSQGLVTQITQNNNQYSFARLYTNDTDSKEASEILMTSNEKNASQSLPGGIKITSEKDQVTKGIFIRPNEGIRFTNNRTYNTIGGVSSIVGSSYIFPTDNGSVNEVLTTDGNAQDATLSWKNISDIVTSASPKFFYMPSVSLPINATNTSYVEYTVSDQTYTVDLYAAFKAQFETPIKSSNGTANGLQGLVLAREAYEYHIVYADNTVFPHADLVFVPGAGNEGILKYKVNPATIVTNSAFMNIVLKVK